MRKTRSFLEMITTPISLLLIMQGFAAPNTAEAAQPAVPPALESAAVAEVASMAMVADLEDELPTGWFRYSDADL